MHPTVLDQAVFASIVEQAEDAIVVVDENLRFVYLNQGAERMFGYAREDIIGRSLDLLIPEDFRPAHRALVERFAQSAQESRRMSNRGSIFAVRKGGSTFPADATIVKVRAAEGIFYAAIVRDVTEAKKLQDKLQTLASTDYLTELMNRRGFFEAAESEFDRSRRYGYPLAFLMIDVDRFKDINDIFGHAQGDQVLRRVSDICSGSLRRHDILGRVGGEEFAAILVATDEARARAVAERIRKRVEACAMPLGTGTPRLTVSIGIAITYEAAAGYEEMLNQADQALYTAKRQGRNRAVLYDGPLFDSPRQVSIA